MKKAPSLWSLHMLLRHNFATTEIDGKWIPARPLGFYSIWYRLELAWGVFIGRYDALEWGGGQ